MTLPSGAVPTPGLRVVVIGGGIAGLTVAYRLLRAPQNGRAVDVLVLEAESRPGGKLRTVRLGDIQLEEGADSFVVRKPAAVELCRELGLAEDLVTPAARGASVLTRGRLVPFPRRSAFGIPADPEELLRWPGLRPSARLRATADLVLPVRRGEGDESVGGLVTRRMGRAVTDVLVGPLLAGIHAGEPDSLSVQATFPELRAWERRHGSLIRAARASLRSEGEKEREDRPPLFATVWSGLSTVVDTLQRALGPARVRLKTSVTGLRRSAHGYDIETAEEVHRGDAVVLAIPAFEAARLLSRMTPAASRELEAIPYVSTGVVSLVYPEGTAPLLPNETGFVVPTSTGVVAACTYLSRKWPREGYGDRAVLRCFVGRAGQQQPLELGDAELVLAVRREVEPALGLQVPPAKVRVTRWQRAMPQYEVGHLERVSRIEEAVSNAPGIFLTGSAYGGVGIAACVESASHVAKKVLEHLHGTEAGQGLGPLEREAI